MSLLPNLIPHRNWDDITLALAAVIQDCEQIHLFAQGQTLDEQVFKTGIQSLFVFNPQDVPQIFGGTDSLKRGLTWIAQLNTSKVRPKDRDILQYLTSLLYLMRRVLHDNVRLSRLHERLQKAQMQVNYFHASHPQVIAGIADIYSESISNLSFRIQIRGLRQVLTQDLSMQTVRCLLLAGLRAAILWHQVGGRRWQLVFARKRLSQTARRLLADSHE